MAQLGPVLLLPPPRISARDERAIPVGHARFEDERGEAGTEFALDNDRAPDRPLSFAARSRPSSAFLAQAMGQRIMAKGLFLDPHPAGVAAYGRAAMALMPNSDQPLDIAV